MTNENMKNELKNYLKELSGNKTSTSNNSNNSNSNNSNNNNSNNSNNNNVNNNVNNVNNLGGLLTGESVMVIVHFLVIIILHFNCIKDYLSLFNYMKLTD